MFSYQKHSYRWTVVALLFFATTINYIDRQVLSLLKPALAKEFNWSEKDYGYIQMCFQAMYAAGLLFFGKIVDNIGSKKGYTVSVVLWSIAAMLHSFVRSTFGFAAARAALGAGESGNFPSAVKSVAEWFPKKERALAIGIFNSGTSIGAVVAAIIVPLAATTFGWQYAFLITGCFGLVWLILWIISYEIPERKKKLTKEEFDIIRSDKDAITDPSAKPMKWLQLITYKQTWAFIFGKLFTDPVWWFFLFWLPSYFSSTFQLDLSKPGWPLVIIYASTTIGSIGGGYLSSWLIHKGWSPYKARKKTLLICAVCVLPIVSAQFIHDMWTAVILISIATAAHQAWSSNIFTTASDFFQTKDVSAVVGMGGMAGAVGGIIIPLIAGIILDHYKALGNITTGYNILFIICGFAYLFAWFIMHLLTRNIKRVPV